MKINSFFYFIIKFNNYFKMSNIDLNNKAISQFNPKEVKEFIKEIGLSSYSAKFEKYQIDGYDLCNITDDLLKLLDFSNIHDINKLKRNIHVKLLNQLKINLSFENKNYPFQLDYLPDFTVENLEILISKALNIKDILLCTFDNQILTPQIKFIELLLVEYEKYKNLKIFNFNDNQKKSEIQNLENENKENQYEIKKENSINNEIPENKKEEKEKLNYNMNMIDNKQFNIKNNEEDILKKNNNDILPKDSFNKGFSNEIKKDFKEIKKEYESDFNKNYNKDFKKDLTQMDFKSEYKSTDFNKDFNKQFNPNELNKDFNPKDFNKDFNSKDLNTKEYIPRDYKRDLNIESDTKREILNSNYKELNSNIKTTESYKEENQPEPQMQIPQKYSKDYKSDFSYKSYTPSTNYSLENNLNKNKSSINEINDLNDNNQKKMFQNKYISQLTSNNDNLLKGNFSPELNLNKDKKDFNNEINNKTSNYIFNSGELNKYEKYNSLNKNFSNQNPTLESLVTESPEIKKNPLSNNLNHLKDNSFKLQNNDTFMNRKFDNYLNNNTNTFKSNISETPNLKDNFKQIQSEKRTFRNYNDIQNNEIINTIEDYKPKQYQKYNQNPLEELNDKFNSNEQFNKFSTRFKQNNMDDIEDINSNFKNNNNKTITSLRGQIGGGNFGLDRKSFQMDNQYNFKMDK